MEGWQNHPFEIKITAGETIAFCMFDKSQNGPCCDGSHQGSGMAPEVAKYDREKQVFAFGCQQSKNRPFCDASIKPWKNKNF